MNHLLRILCYLNFHDEPAYVDTSNLGLSFGACRRCGERRDGSFWEIVKSHL